MIIYDCEIINTPDQNPPKGVKKCGGWRDFGNMGISCICAYDYTTDEYRVFLEDNLEAFQKLVNSHEVIVGFNSIAFDNRLCKAYGLSVQNEKRYDLLCEVRAACGLSLNFEDGKREEHVSLSLDALSERNFGLKKSGHGANAPILWQQGKFGAVIDYCLRDVMLTKKLMDRILNKGKVIGFDKEVLVQRPEYHSPDGLYSVI